MTEMRFVNFSSLEDKLQKRIEKRFPGIKDSDLIYIEHCEFNKDDYFSKFYDTYVVTVIDNDGIDIACSLHGEKSCLGIDDKVNKALEKAPKGFTIYSPSLENEESTEDTREIKKAEASADPESDKFEQIKITRKCGHEELVTIPRTNDEDYRAHLIFEELNKRPLCRDCWEKETKNKAKKAKESAKKDGLPVLKGSAKQKKWAETIRAEKLNMLEKDPAMYEVLCWYIKNYIKASEWIDVRFMDEWQLKENMKINIHLKERNARKEKQ